MGRVRTKTVKRAAKILLEKHYQKLTNDFHINKRILSEVAKVPTKKLRNKIAGFATHLVKRIQKGPVKGISLKVQEEERERRLDWVPKESEIKTDKVVVDTETVEMIKKRFGEEFATKISANLEIRNVEQHRKTGGKDGKRRNQGKDFNKGERKPRERKEGDKPVVEGQQPVVAAQG
jgi:small subunit ribosomal protein S17e